MFFDGFIRRRLETLLRPWLKDDEELRLSVGFLRSSGVLNNISLNTAALNELLDDPTRFYFKEVTVEQLSLIFAPFSATAFTLVVRGLHVVVSLGEAEDEHGLKWKPKPRDTIVEERNEFLREVDPEGYALHCAVKKISEIATSTWNTSFWNNVMRHCCLQLHDFHVFVDSPHFPNPLSCSFYMEKFASDPRIFQGCFVLGCIRSLFVAIEKGSFNIEVGRCEISLNSENETSRVFFLNRMLTSVNFNSLQSRAFCFEVPSLDLALSPLDLSAMLLLYEFFSKERKHARDGRVLWNIVSARIYSLIPRSKLSLVRTVKSTCLWLRYINTYQNLLLCLGFPADDMVKRSMRLMMQDAKYSRFVRSQWNLIAEIENYLPFESIALARRIIRTRAASGAHRKIENLSQIDSSISKFHYLLSAIFRLISTLLFSFMKILFLHKVVGFSSAGRPHVGSVFENALLEQGFTLKVREVMLSFRPGNVGMPSVTMSSVPFRHVPYKDLLSFHFSVDGFFIEYSASIFEYRFTFASEKLNVVSSAAAKAVGSSFPEQYARTSQSNRKIILWGEPAVRFNYAGAAYENGSKPITGTAVSDLDQLLKKLWHRWEDLISEAGNAPWILCEIQSGMAGHRASSSFNCSLVFGKLNFDLEYLSLKSVSVIFSRIQFSPFWYSRRRKNAIPKTSDYDSVLSYRSKNSESYSNKIEMEIARMVPERDFHIGVLIAGPQIVISLSPDQSPSDANDLHSSFARFTFDVCDIEFLASPNLEDNVGGLLSEKSTEHDIEESECLSLDELQPDSRESDSGSYSCQLINSLNVCLKFNGLIAYYEQQSGGQKNEFIILQPIKMQLRGLRKTHHSVGLSVTSVSAVSRLAVAGIFCLIFLDELAPLMKIIFEVCNESLAFAMGGAIGDPSYVEESRMENVDPISECRFKLYFQWGQTATVIRTKSIVRGNVELNSFEIVLHNSRKGLGVDTHLSIKSSSTKTDTNDLIHEAAHTGIHVSIQPSALQFIYRVGNLNFVADMHGVQFVAFRFLTEVENSTNRSGLKDVLHSLNPLIGASVNYCNASLRLMLLEQNLPSQRIPDGGNDESDHTETIEVGSLGNAEDRGVWDNLSANMVLSGISLTEWHLKDIFVNESEDFNMNVYVGGEFREVSCECKGGIVFLQASSLRVLIDCLSSYYQRIPAWNSHQSLNGIMALQRASETALLDGDPAENPHQVKFKKISQGRLKSFSFSLSSPSFILVERHNSGRLQELRLAFDFYFILELLNAVRKLSVTASKLSIVSRSMLEDAGHHFSVISSNGDSSSSFIRQESLHKISQHFVVKDIQFSLSVEGPIAEGLNSFKNLNSSWIGHGSVSEFDVAISLNEIKMVISTYEALSRALTTEQTSTAEFIGRSHSEEPEGNLSEMVPDGTIVALQDVDQHTYVVVERAESRFKITGAIHYSVVGEQALFRIKYKKSRMWKSEAEYFTLTSLYAEKNYGESLRLNFHARSRVVDISCTDENPSALWKMLPFKSDAYENSTELEYSTSLSRGLFHLVNKKNDFGVAFTNGILEFISKPGNLFKWKVFDGHNPPGSSSLSPNWLRVKGTSSLSPESSELHVPGTGPSSITIYADDSHTSEKGEIKKKERPFGILIAVNKVAVTVCHELSSSEERFPLLQVSLMPNQIIVQVSDSKVRVMNSFEVNLYYFNGQQNLWKNFIQPLELCIFYSQNIFIHGAESSSHGFSKHFYIRTGEVSVFLTQLSLDILLFVIGKLDLAGPYAVKSSAVLGNCCKVENKSGLTLVCQFYGNQEVAIHASQSNTIFLRHMALANQPLEGSFISAQLVKEGFFSSSPIRLSLLEARKISWRSRVVSLQDSKSFPGPFIIIEISKGVEDGLSISVSPLLKIHNDTDFQMELRFQRPSGEEPESASFMLGAGDVIDDAVMAFTGIDIPGNLRKVLASLSVGNYLFSFRPVIAEGTTDSTFSVDWSDDVKGGKPVRLSGLVDKLNYQMREALSINSMKFSMYTGNCALKSGEGFTANLYFHIETVGMSVPIVHPDNSGYVHPNGNQAFLLQEQKEIFVLPTIQVLNLLHTEIHVSLTDTDGVTASSNFWNRATIACGSTANFYVNPDTIFFQVTLASFGLRCEPASSRDWMRKLQKQKGDIPHLDVELNFGGGKHFAILRLFRGQRGTLKAGIFTPYSLQNNTNSSLLCISMKQRPLSRDEMERFGTDIPLDLGLYLPPNSIKSWFLRSHKIQFMLLEEKTMDAQLNLDLLSGLTQIDLESQELFGLRDTMRLGVSLRPELEENVPSQTVSFRPRYILCNESETPIAIRQCYVEDIEGSITIGSKQRMALRLKKVIRNNKTTNVIDHILRNHTKSLDDSAFFIQFRPIGTGLGWSGPVCVASLGRFFLRFRKSSGFSDDQLDTISYNSFGEFAAIHTVEDGSSIILHFHWPTLTETPYRIENFLRDAPITYYQKGSYVSENLGAGSIVNYVWDDLTLPHKLVIQSDDLHLLHEINLDKVRPWKPFRRNQLSRGLVYYGRLMGSDALKLGYEVYAVGITRVLRICELSESSKVNRISGRGAKFRLRISYFSIQLLEKTEEEDVSEQSECKPIIIAKLENINWNAVSIDRYKCMELRIQSLSVDEKWAGAPFSAMLRQHRSEKSNADDHIICVSLVLLPLSSHVKQVKSLSILLQPLDLNVDEGTLMKLVPFWRRSLSESTAPRRQYYFDRFEIHPIKIVASFLPGESDYRYSSAQETLRSLIHSVIKVPAIRRKTVELNGVLVTHALITLRELAVKCAQHYSWYVMRAVYIAKGSPLLPPDFASLFDDLASSSLDVFFDPSSGFLNLPNMTLGTLKLVSKFIANKGFSGTKRYFGDLGKTLKTAGSNVVFAAVTEISDSVLKGAEASGFNGMVTGFHHGILKLAMEPSVLSGAFMEGGPDRKIKLDRSPGVDELYIEGYLQAMLDTTYKQEYLRVRVIEDQVILKSLPPSTALINEITENVKIFLESKSLLKAEASRGLQHVRGEREWRIGPTILTLCEHLFVSFVIRFLREQSSKVMRLKGKKREEEEEKTTAWKWGIGRFALSGVVAYVDGRLCRHIPHPLARRIVSGFLLSFLDRRNDDGDADDKSKQSQV